VAAELPRSKPRQNLFEFQVPEMEFRHSQKYISSLFTAAEVEGVYESRVPLNFRAVLQLGAVCQLSKVAKSQGSKEVYALADLEIMTKGNTYLQANSLKRIFLYHSFSDKIGIWGVFMVEQQKALVVIIDPHQNAQLPGIRRQLKERLPSFEFDISQVKDKKSAYSAVDKTLKTYSDRNKTNPTVMLTQCTKSYYELSQNIPALSSFPNIGVPANEQDNNYSLGWQAKAAAILAQRYLAVDGWYKAILERARYSQVPIGNLETDHPVFFSDIMYSRLLKKSNNLLWISETTLPDLGGSEEDDKSFAEELATPEVLVPGCYKSVCIELDLIGLAVNTVLQSNSITEIEGGSSLLSFDFNPTLDEDMNKVAKSIRSFDETFGCLKAFKILKALITEWSCNIGESFSDDNQTESADNSPAAILLGHFYRWISNPHSKLYDPSLHRMIHNFIKKVFWQLLAELRNLGSTIVFANFNKVSNRLYWRFDHNMTAGSLKSLLSCCDRISNIISLSLLQGYKLTSF
jgi:DNA polymerase epsilon subunit 1